MEPLRLVTLRGVPDNHLVRHDADQCLARQVVPAPHTERAANAQRARRTQVVQLRRTELDERRNEQDVGLLRGDELVDTALPGHRPFEQRQHSGQHSAERRLGEPQNQQRRALVRPLTNSWRRFVSRIRIAQVIEADAQCAGQLPIPAPLRDRRVANADPFRVFGGQTSDHLAPAPRSWRSAARCT
jgi:hypothetical protein